MVGVEVQIWRGHVSEGQWHGALHTAPVGATRRRGGRSGRDRRAMRPRTQQPCVTQPVRMQAAHKPTRLRAIT